MVIAFRDVVYFQQACGSTREISLFQAPTGNHQAPSALLSATGR